MTFAATRLFCVGILALALCACASFGTQPQRPFDVTKALQTLSTECFDQNKIDSCMKSSDQVCRDQIVYGQIHAYDLVLSEFEDQITRLSQKINLTGDLLAGLFSGAGSVVKGTQTKSIVSALAAFATGAKSSADADLFFQKSLASIVSRIEALRKEALLPIRTGLLKQPSEYSLDQALLDVEDYFKAVSLTHAIASIDENSEQKAKAADDAKNTTLDLVFSDDDNSTLLRNFWRPNNQTNAENAKTLQDWIDKNVKPGLSKTAFIHGKTYAAARARAVADIINGHQ